MQNRFQSKMTLVAIGVLFLSSSMFGQQNPSSAREGLFVCPTAVMMH